MSDKSLEDRINSELKVAGTSSHAMHKNEVRYLPQIIHQDEHIGAAANGRTELGSVMLVATNHRVMFLDCKSFYTTTDEISYDVVSGVTCHVQGLFANITLHTRLGDYHLKLVNVKQAKIFADYIETRRLATEPGSTWGSTTVATEKAAQEEVKSIPKAITLDRKAKLFLNTHNLAVISTVDRTGIVYGAAVYYVVMQDILYILTKSDTSKARNILSHQQVALTIVEELTYEILQINGNASLVTDLSLRQSIFTNITNLRNMTDQTTTPPVTKLLEGSYVVLAVTITDAKYRNYKD